MSFIADLLSVQTDRVEPLFILGIVLVGGAGGGWVARRLHAPAITGNILAGGLLGLTLFREIDVAQTLQPLSTFAISLIAVTAGGHFSYRRVHNALKRILLIAFFEVSFAVCAVGGVLLLLGARWEAALILGCLAAGTAPATTVALIRENRAKGPFVKTLLAVVSLDSSLCILLFAFVHNLLAARFATHEAGLGFSAGMAQTGWILIGSVVLGLLVGYVAARLFEVPRFHDLSTKAVAVLLAAGASTVLGLSPLLTCLVFGAFLGNYSPESEKQLKALEPLEPLLFTCFFTLAGAAIHLDILADAGLLCVGYLLARALGKALGATVGAILSGSSQRIRTSIPMAFIPQAGVALGLVVIFEGDPRIPTEFSAFVGTIVLAAVAVNEIIGPFFTRASLRRAREAGLDRPRLVEFLQEEFILTNLSAEDKWDALRKLMDFYALVHHVTPEEKKRMWTSVEERERDGGTAIGRGAAIPHGWVETGSDIEGVLGICPSGVPFDAPDGEPVKIIVLILTPREHKKRHLEVLSSLTRMISDPRLRARLISASDANDAWEIIEGEESRSYNYFLEDDGVEGG